MSGLVNYSSEEGEQDEFQYTKAGERERDKERPKSAKSGTMAAKKMKHRRERTSSSSSESSNDAKAIPPPRKEKYAGGSNNNNNKCSRSGKGGYNNDEEKHKSERRSEKHKEERRDKRDERNSNKHFRDNRYNRDNKEDNKDYGNGHWNDNKKYDDNKRYGKDHKRDSGSDYHRDEKRPRNDDKKSHSSNYKDRFNSSKSRYDARKSYDDKNGRDDKRLNDDRRHSSNTYRKDYDDSKDYRHKDDNRSQRSHNQDRSNKNRSNTKRPEDERKPHHSPDKSTDHNTSTHREHSIEIASRPEESKTTIPNDVVEKKVLPTARNFEALLTLPLSEAVSKQTNVVTVPLIAENAAETTTVQLPSYYNPKVINPTKYAQQMQKRKLIWGAKKTEDAASKWGHAQFSQDSDGKVASKFMRLMGIKNAQGDEGENKDESVAAPSAAPVSTKPDFKSREAMFSTMEQQYEVARQVTHTMRGVGLGFSSQNRPF